MATISIKIDKGAARQLKKALHRYPEIAEPLLQRAIRASEATLASHTLKDDPIPWRTGNLLHSFRYKESRLRGHWFPTAPYAKIVDEGGTIPPRVIKPRRRKALYWKGAKHPVKSVRHPGGTIRPRRYIKKLADKSQPDIEKVFTKTTHRIADAIAAQVR